MRAFPALQRLPRTLVVALVILFSALPAATLAAAQTP